MTHLYAALGICLLEFCDVGGLVFQVPNAVNESSHVCPNEYAPLAFATSGCEAGG